jgi:hypothetical protein
VAICLFISAANRRKIGDLTGGYSSLPSMSMAGERQGWVIWEEEGHYCRRYRGINLLVPLGLIKCEKRPFMSEPSARPIISSTDPFDANSLQGWHPMADQRYHFFRTKCSVAGYGAKL